MLRYETDTTCGCCGTTHVPRAYQWHAFRYCTTCLHSIGINAAGNYCTPKQYREAWRVLSEEGVPTIA